MPAAARCPSCGAALGEAAVLAVAPVCSHCGAVIIETGGTLGLTGVYGVSDPTITRRRVEADLAVFAQYQERYRGAKEACLQQLAWDVERYAELPHPPELLVLDDTISLKCAAFRGIYYGYILPLLTLLSMLSMLSTKPLRWDGGVVGLIFVLIPGVSWLAILGALLTPPGRQIGAQALIFWAVLYEILRPVSVTIANGLKPRENARRQKAYKVAVAAALKAAEPLKAAEDYRLRNQIRELESLTKTVGDKAVEVQRLLSTL